MVTDDEDASAGASRGSRDEELPPLETPTEVAEEEEEEEEDDDETQVPPQSRKHNRF